MSLHSAGGRKSVRIPKGPAKVIPFPTGQRRRRYRRWIGIGTASLGAVTGAALVWFYVVPFLGMSSDLTAGMSIQEGEILRLVNDERKRVGAAPLISSQRLVLASRGHSYDMAMRNYFGHNGPAGDTPAERARGVGVSSPELGENLYFDRDANREHLPQRTIQQWLANPERRANMLSQVFRSTGVGIARAADGAAYVTEDFIK